VGRSSKVGGIVVDGAFDGDMDRFVLFIDRNGDGDGLMMEGGAVIFVPFVNETGKASVEFDSVEFNSVENESVILISSCSESRASSVRSSGSNVSLSSTLL